MISYKKDFFYQKRIILMLSIFISFLIVKSSSFICQSNLNNCYKCNPRTNLCEICNYPDILIPDKSGGCTGALRCYSGKNYCKQCDKNGELCQKCDEGFIKDENGGCTYSPNCILFKQLVILPFIKSIYFGLSSSFIRSSIPAICL